jgi:hypothetical protein
MQDDNEQTVITGREARQGRSGWRVATVLAVSLFLALIVLIGLMVWVYS